MIEGAQVDGEVANQIEVQLEANFPGKAVTIVMQVNIIVPDLGTPHEDHQDTQQDHKVMKGHQVMVDHHQEEVKGQSENPITLHVLRVEVEVQTVVKNEVAHQVR